MFTKVTETRKGVKELLTQIPAHYPIRSAQALLSQKQIAPFLKKLETIVNAPPEYYQALYQSTITNFANFIQGLPASKVKSFNYHGGFLDLSIERTYKILISYRKDFPVIDIKPELMPPRLALWTYALFTIGLFYGIGEVCATYWVTVTDEKGHQGTRWQPFEDIMENLGTHYRYSFESITRDDLAAKAAPLLARQLMGDGFDWLARDREIFTYWLRLMQNIHTDTGILAQFVLPIHDQLMTQDPLNLGMAPVNIDIEHNREAIKKSFLDSPDHKETHNPAEITKFDVTHAAIGLGGALTDLDITGANTTELGEIFINWLRIGIVGQTISVNRNDSKVHVTAEGLLLLQLDIYADFVKANPQYKTNWQDVRKSFIDLGYVIGSQNKAQQFTNQVNTGRQFNISGAKAGISDKGDLIDPTMIFNTQVMPQPLTHLNPRSGQTATYPVLIGKSVMTKSPSMT